MIELHCYVSLNIDHDDSTDIEDVMGTPRLAGITTTHLKSNKKATPSISTFHSKSCGEPSVYEPLAVIAENVAIELVKDSPLAAFLGKMQEK